MSAPVENKANKMIKYQLLVGHIVVDYYGCDSCIDKEDIIDIDLELNQSIFTMDISRKETILLINE